MCVCRSKRTETYSKAVLAFKLMSCLPQQDPSDQPCITLVQNVLQHSPKYWFQNIHQALGLVLQTYVTPNPPSSATSHWQAAPPSGPAATRLAPSIFHAKAPQQLLQYSPGACDVHKELWDENDAALGAKVCIMAVACRITVSPPNPRCQFIRGACSWLACLSTACGDTNVQTGVCRQA